MATKFEPLFDQWADTYDQTVSGHDEEYKAVFEDYDRILTSVAERTVGTVLEFGVGTGNLTEKLLARGRHVFGVEPSKEMRKKAKEKVPSITLLEGDFLHFPPVDEPIHTVTSTYAFHHLTDAEKSEAICRYSELLPVNGKIVFADTVFETEEARQEIMEKVRRQGYEKLLEDLQTEYYTTIAVLKQLFREHNFYQVTFSRFNQFVWLFEAVKQ